MSQSINEAKKCIKKNYCDLCQSVNFLKIRFIATCPSRDELAAAEASCGKPAQCSSHSFLHFFLHFFYVIGRNSYKPLSAGGGTQASGSCPVPAR